MMSNPKHVRVTGDFSLEKGRNIWRRRLENRQVAGDWDADVRQRTLADHRFLEFVWRYCPASSIEPPRILEDGCGSAVNLFQIAERLSGRGFGIDLVRDVHALHRGYASCFSRDILFAVGNGIRLPLASASMDLIFSRGVFEHHRDPGPALEEEIRVLKPGGLLIIGVPQFFNPYTLVKHLSMWRGTWAWGWETQYTLSDLVALGREGGLEYLGGDGDGYNAGADLGLGRARRLVGRLADDRSPVVRSLARWLDRRFAALEASCAPVLFQEVLAAFRKPVVV